MAEIRHIETAQGKKVEVTVTAEELMKALRYQDLDAFGEIKPNYDEYCLTFEEV